MVILYTLFLSLPISTYPESWKLANVNPIRKKGSRNDITNSRPIYFLPITGRSWQGVFSIILWTVFIPIIFLCSNQSGFIPGHSTVYQLHVLDITNTIGEALGCSKKELSSAILAKHLTVY